MPGVKAMGASADSTERPSWTSRKTLPRREIVVIKSEIAQPVSRDRNGSLSATPAPPLTPPRVNQEANVHGDRTPRKVHSESQNTGMLTPRRPSKPPTPDVTPPRTTSKRPTLNQFVHLSSSSRAESFQTARESIPSDGEMETPGRSSRNMPDKIRQRTPSRRNVSATTRAKLAYVKDSPPPTSQPHSETEYETGFESFDGDNERASTQANGSPTPVARKRQVSKTRNQSISKQGAGHNDLLDVQHLNASLMREKSLRDQVRNTQEAMESPSLERFREDIGWQSHSGASPAEEADSRRLSGISSTSTVEAMIIDSPKRAQRLLRHTEKRNSLRSASSPITKSERTSIVSNPDSQHRLIHKAARISEQDRRSISSDISLTTRTTSSVPQPSVDIIPVVVIPERRSSLRSGPNSRVASRPASQRSGQRPPVASNSAGEGPRQRKRTMSDSIPAPSRDTDSRGRPFGRPVIPPRSSSLSAPTSRNNSRTTSLTSESLRSHTLAMDLEMQKRNAQQPVSPPRHNILGPNNAGSLEAPDVPALMVSPSDDMATLRPPSLPYTQWSIPSSSPGPVEIREAKAVSLFAHNNRSLLLVHQRVPPASTQQHPTLQEEVHDLAVQPRTPDLPTRATTIHVESPLTNPRPPPKPPVAKALPPFPVNERPVDLNQHRNGRPARRWDSVRRTWGARPRSDTFNSIARSLSMKSAINRKAGVEMDSRLQPFWRPRGFWDGVPGSPEKTKSDRHSPEALDDSLIVNNSLGLPQRRIILDGPPGLAARRSPEMRRLFNASHASLVDGRILRTGSPLYQQRYWALSRWGLRLRSISWHNVRNRLRCMRQRRDERKRAARRETLKRSIGCPVYVASSATNGVVR